MLGNTLLSCSVKGLVLSSLLSVGSGASAQTAAIHLPVKLVLTLCLVEPVHTQVLDLYNVLTEELVFPDAPQDDPLHFQLLQPVPQLACDDWVIDQYEVQDIADCEVRAQELNGELEGYDESRCAITGPE